MHDVEAKNHPTRSGDDLKHIAVSGNRLDSDAGTNRGFIEQKIIAQARSASVDSSCGLGISYHTDGWMAAAGTEEIKPTGQLANPSEWLSNPLRVRRGPGAANAKGSPRESERTERCRKLLMQLRALEPERDKTRVGNYEIQTMTVRAMVNHNSLTKDRETRGALKGKLMK